MLVNTSWLLHYLEPAVSHGALLDAFPKVGLEIEESKPLETGAGFVAELNVLANRPDCLGMIGVAREIAAHLGLQLKLPAIAELITKTTGPSPLSVEIRNPELCPRYMGRVMTGVKVAPSPKWLADILHSIGQRPINNVVDITNFVMFEWGQPLHAFDFAHIAGKKIIVRTLDSIEKLELLGGKTIDAGPAGAAPALVIADAQRPVALAGIMGGMESETRSNTVDVLVESAHFDPPSTRKTRKRIDVSTESSFRFERGVDPNAGLEGAMQRACSLIAELAGGKPVGSAVDAYPKRIEPRAYQLTPQRVSAYLGAEVSAATIREALTKLQMNVSDDLTVRVPTWRFDATDPVVLIEDVARLVGYDTLPMRPTDQTPTLGRGSAMDSLRQELACYLSSSGYLECRSPALESAEQIDALDGGASPPAAPIVRLQNPMSRELAVLRTSLLPGLARVVDRNARRGATSARVYEIDKVFRRDVRAKANEKPGAIEPLMAAGIAGGILNEFDWTGRNPQITFYDVKGAVGDILDLAGAIDARFEHANRAGYSPDACAAIISAGASATIGFIGQIDPAVIPIGKTPFKLYAFELDLAGLLATHAAVASSKPPARTPAVVRDLAFVVKTTETFADMQRAIRESAGTTLESLRLIDIYQGQQVAADHRSLALRLTFRAPDRTLTADEVQAQMDRVVAGMKEKFEATLRA